MAKSKNNIATHGLSGQVDQLVFRQWFGKTIVGKTSRHSTSVSAAQEQVRLTFRQATTYAKAAITDNAIRLLYKSKAEPGQSAYNMAVADFFKPPEIGEIDSTGYTGQTGSKIIAAVTDDVKVASVSVKIENPDGSLVEQGDAVLQTDGLHWMYNCTSLNASLTGDIITVTALDLPGHPSVKQKTI